jgi:hypothetical protein
VTRGASDILLRVPSRLCVMSQAPLAPVFEDELDPGTHVQSNADIGEWVKRVVPSGKTTVYLSGDVPTVIDPNAEEGTIAAYGDTQAQTD